MIAINEFEKKQIRQECPWVHIVRTAKTHSKRHRYYMVEDNRAMSVLRRLRGEPEPKSSKPNRRKGDWRR